MKFLYQNKISCKICFIIILITSCSKVPITKLMNDQHVFNNSNDIKDSNFKERNKNNTDIKYSINKFFQNKNKLEFLLKRYFTDKNKFIPNNILNIIKAYILPSIKNTVPSTKYCKYDYRHLVLNDSFLNSYLENRASNDTFVPRCIISLIIKYIIPNLFIDIKKDKKHNCGYFDISKNTFSKLIEFEEPKYKAKYKSINMDKWNFCNIIHINKNLILVSYSYIGWVKIKEKTQQYYHYLKSGDIIKKTEQKFYFSQITNNYFSYDISPKCESAKIVRYGEKNEEIVIHEINDDNLTVNKIINSRKNNSSRHSTFILNENILLHALKIGKENYEENLMIITDLIQNNNKIYKLDYKLKKYFKYKKEIENVCKVNKKHHIVLISFNNNDDSFKLLTLWNILKGSYLGDINYNQIENLISINECLVDDTIIIKTKNNKYEWLNIKTLLSIPLNFNGDLISCEYNII